MATHKRKGKNEDMLQNAVNQLSSGILNTVNGKVQVTGFTREKILQSYLERNLQAWSSKGLYDVEDIVYHNIKSDALIIVQEDGKEIGRHQYKQLHKGTVKFKNDEGKDTTRTFVIRKSVYSDHYHFYFVIEKDTSESKKEKKENDTEENQVTLVQSNLFSTKEELDTFLQERYNLLVSY